MCEEVWKPKESIIKAIITWAESNNFKYKGLFTFDEDNHRYVLIA